MFSGPAPGEFDETGLLEAMRSQLGEGLAGAQAGDRDAFDRAGTRASIEDERHGHMADLLLGWITGGWTDLGTLTEADEILNGNSKDARREKVYDMVRRLSTGAITWEEWAKETKKGLIRRPGAGLPAAAPNALPLASVEDELQSMLATAGVGARPRPEAVWKVFNAFARRPVAAVPPLYVENDMCLFQWGIVERVDGKHFVFDCARQFVLYERDGDYDHMEHLSVTVLLDPATSDVLSLGAGAVWSDDVSIPGRAP